MLCVHSVLFVPVLYRAGDLEEGKLQILPWKREKQTCHFTHFALDEAVTKQTRLLPQLLVDL